MSSELSRSSEQPRLRPIEVFPIDDRGQRCLVLRDPADSELQPIALTDGAAQVLMLLDGQRTVDGDRGGAAAARRSGECRTGAGVRRAARRGRLSGGPTRRAAPRATPSSVPSTASAVAVHAGGAYPDGLDTLPRMLADGYVHADGPGSLPAPRDPTRRPPAPRGVIAPARGSASRRAHLQLGVQGRRRSEPAELYVVLGTCHTPMAGAFAATNKAYDTPLGPVPADAAFVEPVQRAWGSDLFAGEFSHANEHSIEFQAVYLRSLGIEAPMVPILCDSLHSLVPSAATSPREVALVAEFLEALVETNAQRRAQHHAHRRGRSGAHRPSLRRRVARRRVAPVRRSSAPIWRCWSLRWRRTPRRSSAT